MRGQPRSPLVPSIVRVQPSTSWRRAVFPAAMIRVSRRGALEILLVAASGALVVALPIETGMLLAILLSFVYTLYVVARPYAVELARVPGSTVWWPPSAEDQSEHEEGVLV